MTRFHGLKRRPKNVEYQSISYYIGNKWIGDIPVGGRHLKGCLQLIGGTPLDPNLLFPRAHPPEYGALQPASPAVVFQGFQQSV